MIKTNLSHDKAVLTLTQHDANRKQYFYFLFNTFSKQKAEKSLLWFQLQDYRLCLSTMLSADSIETNLKVDKADLLILTGSSHTLLIWSVHSQWHYIVAADTLSWKGWHYLHQAPFPLLWPPSNWSMPLFHCGSVSRGIVQTFEEDLILGSFYEAGPENF